MNFLLFVIAMGLLIGGANLLITQSETIALKLKLSEIIIGATLLVLATSLPEMMVTLVASLNHKPDIALSSLIGSNILNITLIFSTLLLLSSSANRDKIYDKSPLWLFIPVLFFLLMSLDNVIFGFDSVILFALFGFYFIFLIDHIKQGTSPFSHPFEPNEFSWISTIPLLLSGFVLMAIGAYFTIDSALSIAEYFDISPWRMGLIIAFGTSLPELAITLSALNKGKMEIALGNIIGSNIVNMTMALGASAWVNPLPIDISLHLFDIGMMCVATLIMFFILGNQHDNKSASLSLFLLLALFVQHLFVHL